MPEVRLRARSVSELVDAAFALYRLDSGQYVLIMAIATIPQLLLRLFFRSDGTLSTNSVVVALATFVVSSITYTIGAAVIMKIGSSVYLGERADLESTVRSVLPKVGPILVAGFLKGILYGLGFLVFFVGEFYVAARYFAVGAVIVLEDGEVLEAFSRSSALSSGRKRHILNTLLLVWIIYLLLSVCVGVIASLTRSTVVAIILPTAFGVVAAPIVGLTGMLLYYDCRIRGEAFDLERMAASMDRDPGAAPGVTGATTRES